MGFCYVHLTKSSLPKKLVVADWLDMEYNISDEEINKFFVKIKEIYSFYLQIEA